MPLVTRTQIIPLSMLSAQDCDLYDELRVQDPQLDSPYFSSHYLRACATILPKAYLAKFSTASECVGYFGFQMRGNVIQPLGAPLNDYHGAVMAKGFYPDWIAMLKAARAKRFEFTSLMGPGAFGVGFKARPRQISKVYSQAGNWEVTQNVMSKKQLKNIARCRRNLEADFKGLKFEFIDVDDQVLDWVMAHKREQYQRTGRHDITRCGWTMDAIKALGRKSADDYGLRVGVLRDNDTILAAEICLIDRQTLHFWFPAYDPAFFRYSPGLVLTYEIIAHLSGQGFQVFDFGSGGEDYKTSVTIPDVVCFEGHIACPSRLSDALKPLNELWMSFSRRMTIIRACEITRDGQARALVAVTARARNQIVARAQPIVATAKARLARLGSAAGTPAPLQTASSADENS